MTSLAQHQSNDYVKLLLLGDSKSGKTGSLVSLVEAGYELFILDYDNLLDSLKYQILQRCPDRLEQVEFRTLRDKRKTTPMGPAIDGQPRAYMDGIKMLDNWKYKDGDVEVDYGEPYKWGPNRILVLDSLSRFCDAAYDWRVPLSISKNGNFDGLAAYGDAQGAVEDNLATMTNSKVFLTNLIVIAHGIFQEQEDGTKKIFPQGVGQKLSPKIPQYFPNFIRYTNQGGKRLIQLESSGMIDLGNANPGVLKGTLPIETGLATIFEALKTGKVAEPQPTAPVTKPKAVTLRRA